MEDYNEGIGRIIRKYSGTSGLVSIYEWGSISKPGISDIDIVLVFKDAYKPLPFLKRSFYLAGSKVSYLARHPFIFIGEKSLQDINYINPDVELKLLHGRKCSINRLGNKESSHVKISVMNDLIIRHYPRDFLPQVAGRVINVRDTLLRLNSLTYTISTMEGLTGKKNRPWDRAARQIKWLRQNWFRAKDFGLLTKLNEEASDITIEVVGAFRDFLINKKIADVVSGKKVVYKGAKNRSLFIGNWDKETALAAMMENGRYSVLPLELAPQLAEYSKHNGEISSYIRKNIFGNIVYRIKNKGIIKKRIGILNDQASLAKRLKHSDFPAFFDYGYRAKSGINNMVLNLVDKIRY